MSWLDNADNEQGFYIERSDDGGTSWTQTGTTGADIKTYTEQGLTTMTTYWYRVQAYNAVGVSDYSNTITVTTR